MITVFSQIKTKRTNITTLCGQNKVFWRSTLCYIYYKYHEALMGWRMSMGNCVLSGSGHKARLDFLGLFHSRPLPEIIWDNTWHFVALGSCDRASWAKCEERENQQDATIRCSLSTSVSTCFGHHYAHLQDNRDRVLCIWCTALVLLDVVGSGCGALRCRMRALLSPPQQLPSTSSRTRTSTPHAVTRSLFSWRWA